MTVVFRSIYAWLLITVIITTTSSSSSSSPIVDTDTYLATDDATWAVMHPKLSRPIRQKEYTEFMQACRKSAGSLASSLCDRDENYRMQMNMYQPRSVRKYTHIYVYIYTICMVYCM